MRRVAMNADSHHFAIPRGWVIMGGALASWMLFVGLWSGVTTLFGFVASSI